MNRVLIVAPHADDEILGCGATIAKHINHGDLVKVIIATNASKGAPDLFSQEEVNIIRDEALLAHKMLGVNETIFLDFPAPSLNTFPEFRISLELSKIFEKYKPSHLYLPHPGDIHQDHKALYRSSLVAARPQGLDKINYIYTYETLSETDWTPRNEMFFSPNHFVDVTLFFDKKLLAMSCFKSQIKMFPHSRSLEALEALSKLRGSTVGINRAEAFMIERQIC